MKKKWLWVGQRLSDGIMYSRALNDLDVFFSCDSLKCSSPSFVSYSLPTDSSAANEQHKWTSKDISKTVSCHADTINKYLVDNYRVFPYYLSSDSLDKISCTDSIFNKNVFNNQLSRSVQMYLCTQSSVRTPRWTMPYNTNWNDLTALLGSVIVLQFDNTSSGLGTFVVHNEKEYKWFCDFYGQADLATEYLDMGYSCSTHLWITKDSIAISPASIQIIECFNFRENMGIKTFAFKGNDFGFYNQVIGANSDIEGQLYKIASIYQKAGIWGLVGVDYIVKDFKFYYTETNFRLQNSTALLSFIQPTNSGNIVNCLMPGFLEFSNAGCAFQYFTSVPVVHLESGYYNKAGKYIGHVNDPVPNAKENYLVFCNMPIASTQQLRVIGFDIGCVGTGSINEGLKKFMERLVAAHG